MAENCKHLNEIKITTSEKDGCEDCLASGRKDWLNLRLCLECGHVGCCDNSPGKHATAHYNEVGHPAIRDMAKGTTWGYCYPDDLFIEEFLPPM